MKDKDNLERRFKSKIRQPEILYKHLRQNDLGHLVQNYKPLQYQFSDDIVQLNNINQLKTYLAQASIQLSEIIKKIK